MKMGDDEWSWEKLEAKDSILGGVLEVGGDEGVIAVLLLEGFVNFVQDLDEVGARAAARIENIDIFVSEAVGNVEFFAKDGVHASDHVLDDFGWRVPDTELLAEVRVERLKEGLVEVLDGVILLKSGEEGSAVDAIEDRSCPVEDFREIEFFELAGVGDFMKKFTEDGNTEVVRGEPPVETLLAGGWIFLGPEDPRGEDTVKKSLNERRTEKVFAFLALKGEAQSFFQRFADGSQGGKFAKADACERVASVGSKKPGDRFG